MAVCRLVGWVFLSAALLLIGAEVVRSLEAAGWANLTLGELWSHLDPAALEASGAAAERHDAPALWDPAATAALRLPAWAPPLALAALMLWACRRRRFRRRR